MRSLTSSWPPRRRLTCSRRPSPLAASSGPKRPLSLSDSTTSRHSTRATLPDVTSSLRLLLGSTLEASREQPKLRLYADLPGIDALVGFVVEGDAGGENAQIQSLWLYQASGGLPSKEYYEEKPILDLYTSVVQGILVDIASQTSSETPDKRDIVSDLIQLSEEEIQGWPWPWPGDDDGGKKPQDPPHAPPKKDEPIETRMRRLAVKVVQFEREIIRAGADPEDIFNPHLAYNPFPTETVGKNLPFLDLPTYFSAFAIRGFPENITVTYPAYLKSVSKLVNETPDHVLSGYFVTRLALSYASALGPKTGVRSEARRLEEVLKGIKKGTEENREDVCLSRIDDVVGYIAGGEFVREAFSPEAKKEGETIINSEWRLDEHLLTPRHCPSLLRQAPTHFLDGRDLRQSCSEEGQGDHSQGWISASAQHDRPGIACELVRPG
jgi:hypothetical protein